MLFILINFIAAAEECNLYSVNEKKNRCPDSDLLEKIYCCYYGSPFGYCCDQKEKNLEQLWEKENSLKKHNFEEDETLWKTENNTCNGMYIDI